MTKPRFAFAPQQLGVIHCSADLLAVLAFAGSGKTTTLQGYASARPEKRILYLAFNASTRDDARTKFGRNVKCKTTHGLAYRSHGAPFSAAGKLRDIRETDVMREFNILAIEAHWVLRTVVGFMHSSGLTVDVSHVPGMVPPSELTRTVDRATELWSRMRDLERKNVPMPFDGYLKLYALSRPDLSRQFDIILFDEAQDANPVTIDLLLNQRCIRVFVGDPHQAIYGFRGAVNAFDGLTGATTLPLTGSYRFGEDVAILATTLLATYKGETRVLQGLGPQDQMIDTFDENHPVVRICRTNAKVFAHAIESLGRHRMHFIGGVNSYMFNKLLDVYRLWAGEEVQNPIYRDFGTVEELADHAISVNDRETINLIKLVGTYGDEIPRLVSEVKSQAEPDIGKATAAVTTTHKVKGAEFPQVQIADGDFSPLVDSAGNLLKANTPEAIEEVNMHYVALTRATHRVRPSQEFGAAVDGILAAWRSGAFPDPSHLLHLPAPPSSVPGSVRR